MWIIILIGLTANGIETSPIQDSFDTKAECELVADGAEVFMRALAGDPNAATFAKCVEIPMAS